MSMTPKKGRTGSSSSSTRQTGLASLSLQAKTLLGEVGREHGRIIPLWFRHIPPNGELLNFWIHTDRDAGTIHLLPYKDQNDEKPYAWPYKRDTNGNWIWGPATIDLIDFMSAAEKDGRGPDWCNRIRQGLLRLEGDQETRKYSLAELKREDPKFHVEIKTAMAKLRKRYQTPLAAPESDAEAPDSSQTTPRSPIASEGPLRPSNDKSSIQDEYPIYETYEDESDVPF